MQSGAKIMGRLHHHPAGRRRRVLPSRVWNPGSKSGATHFSGNGGFLKQQLPVGDSIIDLGESRHKKRREEETPLNFLVLFFKSDKWLAKMSVLPFCHAIFAAADSTLATRKVRSMYCERGNILL